MYLTLFPGDETVLKKVREALPRNPKVAVETKRKIVSYRWRRRVILPLAIKMSGVAMGSDGLIFTFENGARHVLPFNGKISVVIKETVEPWANDPYKARVSFTNSKGQKVYITLKH